MKQQPPSQTPITTMMVIALGRPIVAAASRACIVVVLAGSLGILGVAGGCQRGPARPKTVPVDVTVTYRDKLVSGATVVFVPQEGGPRGAVGRTNAEGLARLMTFVTGDGAIPGSYRVTIDKLLDEAGPSGASQEEYEAFWKANKGPSNLPPLKCELPWKYGQIEKTDLSVEVSEQGKNSFRFNLVD